MNRLTLYNMAIAHVSGSPIQSTTNEVNAEVCNTFIDICIDKALESHDFSFARKRSSLIQNLTADNVGDFTYSFQKPTDLIQIRSIDDAENGDWKVYGEEIGFDSEELILNYTYAIRIIPNLSQNFAYAISYLLAYHIQEPIAGKDLEKKDYFYAQYLRFLKEAIGADTGLEFLSTQGESEFVEE